MRQHAFNAAAAATGTICGHKRHLIGDLRRMWSFRRRPGDPLAFRRPRSVSGGYPFRRPENPRWLTIFHIAGSICGNRVSPSEARQHVRDAQPVGDADCLAIDLATTDDADLVGARHAAPAHFGQRQRVAERGDGFGSLGPIGRIAADHDVGTPRQRPSREALPGLAAHDEGLAHRARLEALHVARQAPRQSVVAPDDAVLGDGCVDRDIHQPLLPCPYRSRRAVDRLGAAGLAVGSPVWQANGCAISRPRQAASLRDSIGPPAPRSAPNHWRMPALP